MQHCIVSFQGGRPYHQRFGNPKRFDTATCPCNGYCQEVLSLYQVAGLSSPHCPHRKRQRPRCRYRQSQQSLENVSRSRQIPCRLFCIAPLAFDQPTLTPRMFFSTGGTDFLFARNMRVRRSCVFNGLPLTTKNSRKTNASYRHFLPCTVKRG